MTTLGLDTGAGVTQDTTLTARVPAEGQVNLLRGDRVGLGGLLPQDRAAGYHETAGVTPMPPMNDRRETPARSMLSSLLFLPGVFAARIRAMFPARKVGKPN